MVTLDIVCSALEVFGSAGDGALPAFHRSGLQSLVKPKIIRAPPHLNSYANDSVDYLVIETKLDNCSSPDTKRLKKPNLLCKSAFLVTLPLQKPKYRGEQSAFGSTPSRSKARLVEFSSKYVRCIPKINLLEGGFHNSRRCPPNNRP
jgi:hypothetical protein